jgi:chromatin segregation and condensation protein Rec8/ScpA/Scc1 (kleisin family)
LDKQRKIDELEDEVDRLKRSLGKQRQSEKVAEFFAELRCLDNPVRPHLNSHVRVPDLLAFVRFLQDFES